MLYIAYSTSPLPSSVSQKKEDLLRIDNVFLMVDAGEGLKTAEIVADSIVCVGRRGIRR